MSPFTNEIWLSRKEDILHHGNKLSQESIIRKKQEKLLPYKYQTQLAAVCLSVACHHLFLYFSLHTNVRCPDCIQRIHRQPGNLRQSLGRTRAFRSFFQFLLLLAALE